MVFLYPRRYRIGHDVVSFPAAGSHAGADGKRRPGNQADGDAARTYYRINADVFYTMMSRNLTPRHQETLHHDIKKLDTTKKETKKETKNVLPPIPPEANLFDRFWDAYPKKVAKPVAEKAFQKLNPSEKLWKRIISDVEARKTSRDWTKDGGQYIPEPVHVSQSKAMGGRNPDSKSKRNLHGPVRL